MAGKVVGVRLNTAGTGFTSTVEAQINTETGVGASLKVNLKFTEVGEESLPPGQVVTVVNCVGK